METAVQLTDNGADDNDSIHQFEESFGDPTFPGTSATSEALLQYKSDIREYSSTVLEILKKHSVRGEYLWLEFTCSFRVKTIQFMHISDQVEWVTFLRNNGVNVKSKTGYHRWKALRDCLMAEHSPCQENINFRNNMNNLVPEPDSARRYENSSQRANNSNRNLIHGLAQNSNQNRYNPLSIVLK